jgi:hypothetical protein
MSDWFLTIGWALGLVWHVVWTYRFRKECRRVQLALDLALVQLQHHQEERDAEKRP